MLNVAEVSGGKFISFNLEKLISKRLSMGQKEVSEPLLAHIKSRCQNQLISLTVGIDGLPVNRSNKKQFWPILGVVDQALCATPFVIGLFYGYSKPTDCRYLEPFIADCKVLEQAGICVKNVKYSFRVSRILADAPARSFLKGIKGHTSYYSCERCTVKGEWCGRVALPSTTGFARTDETFKNELHKNHHTSESVFSVLNIGMVSQVPLDCLHSLCLGVGRKLFRTWAKGSVFHKLRPSTVKLITGRLNTFKEFFPSDFQRKPRGLNEIDYFKGTEFRSLILYTGIPALDGLLDHRKFKNFVLFHTAVYI